MSNTLRNVAHAAYLRAAANGAEDPWTEVVEAVVKADRKRSWPEPWNSNRKHHAVIEAAKAQRRVLRHKPSIHFGCSNSRMEPTGSRNDGRF